MEGRIADGAADVARDLVRFEITREALAALIDMWNQAQVTDQLDRIVTLAQHEYEPGRVELTGTLHYPDIVRRAGNVALDSYVQAEAERMERELLGADAGAEYVGLLNQAG